MNRPFRALLVALLSLPTVVACHGHVQLEAPPSASADERVRVRYFEANRIQTLHFTWSAEVGSVDSAVLGDGRRVHFAEDLAPAVYRSREARALRDAQTTATVSNSFIGVGLGLGVAIPVAGLIAGPVAVLGTGALAAGVIGVGAAVGASHSEARQTLFKRYNALLLDRLDLRDGVEAVPRRRRARRVEPPSTPPPTPPSEPTSTPPSEPKAAAPHDDDDDDDG